MAYHSFGEGCFIASFAIFEIFLLAQVQNLQFYDESNRSFTSNLCRLHPMRCDAFRVETRHRILLVNRGPQSAALRGHGIQKAIRPQTIRPFRLQSTFFWPAAAEASPSASTSGMSDHLKVVAAIRSVPLSGGKVNCTSCCG